MNSTTREKEVQESEQWHHAFKSETLKNRRRDTYLNKLQRLGYQSWPKDAMILDLCCGSGELLSILRSEGFTNLHGIDITIDSTLAKQQWAKITSGSSSQLSYQNHFFDVVVCFHSLHHLGGIAGISATLNEVARVLKPAGRLALVDFYASPWLKLILELFRRDYLAWISNGLKNFSILIKEEDPYLRRYLNEWNQLMKLLLSLKFRLSSYRRGLFYFYWTGEKY